jgi:hypothetical protein
MATGWPMKVSYANGDVWSSSDANDITGTINLLGASVAYTAGKNKIINGNFANWQRGTSFTASGYTSDRFQAGISNTSGFSVTRSAFTAGTAPVAGYESQYYMDIAGTITSASAGYITVEQKIEDVRTYAGQTVTLSFWAKGSTSGTVNTVMYQNFGSGGSADVLTATSSQSITTSWTRFTQTVTLPSIAGKTIGASSFLSVYFVKNMGSNFPTYGSSNYTGTLSLWGVQLENGSTATAFQTATGTIQGELAACQRYYYQHIDGNDKPVMQGGYFTASTIMAIIPLPVTMRTSPTISVTNGTSYWVAYYSGAADNFDTIGFGVVTGNAVNVEGTGNTAGTAGASANVRSNNASAKLGMSAEL